jgi:hypothetical protein
MCSLNKSKIKTDSHLNFLSIGKITMDDSTKTGYKVAKSLNKIGITRKGLYKGEVHQTHPSTFPLGLRVILPSVWYVSLGYISATTVAKIGDSLAVRAIKWQRELQSSWTDNPYDGCLC